MRHRGSFINRITSVLLALALSVFMLLAMASVAALIGRPNHVTLLSRSANPGRASFVVADRDSIRFARQQMNPRSPGATVDARKLDTFSVTEPQMSTSITTTTSGPQRMSIVGSITINIPTVPVGRGGFGVRWGTFVLPGGPIVSANFIAQSENLTLSYWIILVASVGFAGLTSRPLIRRRRARQRAERHLCATCGYDLRASPERCPECGAPAPPVAVMITPPAMA